MEVESERRYQVLKRKLDALHYSNSFEIQSVPLIEKLLADLIKTTEGFQSIKLKNTDMLKEVDNYKNLVEPLRLENSKLLKDNNQLHYEIIRFKEDKELNSNKSLVAINKLDSETGDLKFLLNKKEATIHHMEAELQQLRDKFDSLAARSTSGVNAPVKPKLVTQGQFSPKDLPSLTDKNGTLSEDWASALRSSDDRCRQLKAKLDEQVDSNRSLAADVQNAKSMIASRDQEITRLSMLYESNINLDKLNVNYSLEKLQRTNENLTRQLEFVNAENNKLADMHKENMTMSETYQSNLSEVKRMNSKLAAKEEECARLRQTLDSKTEQVKRLTEQYNNSQKPALYGDKFGETGQRQLEEKMGEMQKLRDKLSVYQQLESQYNSDKHVYKMNMEELQNKLNSLEYQLNLTEETKRDFESWYRATDEKLKAEQQRSGNLERENMALRESVNKVGSESTYFSDKIASLNAENQALLASASELKRENGRLKAYTEDQDSRKNQQVLHQAEAKEQLIHLQTKTDLLTSELESAKLDNELKRKQIHQLESDRDSLSQLLDSNKKGWDSNEGRLSELLRENQGLSDSVYQLKTEIHRLHEDNRKFAFNAEDLTGRLDNSTKHIKALELELTRTGNTNSSLKDLTTDLEDQRTIIRSKNNEIVELKGKLSKAELDHAGAATKVQSLLNDKKLLENEITGMQNEFTGICQKLTQLEDHDMLIKSYKEEIELLNANLHEKNSENSTLSASHNSLKLDYDRLCRNMDIISAKYGESSKRIELLNNEMMNISVENKATFQKSMEYTGSIHQLKEHNDKLLHDINRYSNEVKSLHTQLADTTLLLDEKNTALLAKDAQINQLKTMLVEFENLNAQMEAKLTSMKYSENDTYKATQEKANTILTLQRELKDSQAKYQELYKTLRMYDQDKDQYSGQLMDKIEENEKISEQLNALKREHSDLTMKYNELVSNSRQVEKQAKGSEEQASKLYSDLTSLQSEVSQLKTDLDFKHRETAELNNDIKILISENQKLNEIHSDLLGQVGAMEDQLYRTREEAKAQEQALLQREAQVDDVMAMYRLVCEENEKLKQLSEGASDDKNQLEGYLISVQQEFESLKSEYNSTYAEMEFYKEQLGVLNKKVQEQSRTGLHAHQLVEDLKFENSKLRQENSMFKTSSTEFARACKDGDSEKSTLASELNAVYAKMDKMDNDFSDLYNEKRELEERCRTLQSELNARDFRRDENSKEEVLSENEYLKDQLNMMKDTVHDIENKLSYHSQAEINTLREENSKLRLENFKFKQDKYQEPNVIRQSSDVSDIDNN